MTDKTVLARLKKHNENLQHWGFASQEIQDLIKDLEAEQQPEFELCKEGWKYCAQACRAVNYKHPSTASINAGIVMPTKELAELHGKLHEIFGRLIQAIYFLEGKIIVSDGTLQEIAEHAVIYFMQYHEDNDKKALEISGVEEVING